MVGFRRHRSFRELIDDEGREGGAFLALLWQRQRATAQRSADPIRTKVLALALPVYAVRFDRRRLGARPGRAHLVGDP